MAIDHISPNTATRGGQMLQTLSDMANQFLQQLARVQSISAHCQDGANYATFEAYFGIPAGTGVDVAFLVGSLSQSLTTDAQVTGLKSALDNLTARLG